MLGPDAPFTELGQIWAAVLAGSLTTRNVTVRLQALNAVGTDLTWFHMHDSSIMGFSDGIATAGYVVIQPGFITFDHANDSLVNPLYAAVDLPIQFSPTFQLLGETQVLGVYQTSGGDRSFAPNSNLGGAPVVSFTDLSVTAVGATASLKGYTANLLAFRQLRDWINAILTGGIQPRSVVFNKMTTNGGGVLATVEYPNCILTRINFINPVLVGANGGVAPYVFDLRLKLTSVQ